MEAVMDERRGPSDARHCDHKSPALLRSQAEAIGSDEHLNWTSGSR